MKGSDPVSIKSTEKYLAVVLQRYTFSHETLKENPLPDCIGLFVYP